MKKSLKMPVPKDIEEYLVKVFPDPEVRNKSKNVQYYREILSRLWFAWRSAKGATDYEKLNAYIRQKIDAMNEFEQIGGVCTIQIIHKELEAGKYPGAGKVW